MFRRGGGFLINNWEMQLINKAIVVDADGHIMESSDLWEKNIEARFKDRALRIRKGDNGLEYLEIDGKKSKIMNEGVFGGYSSFGASLEDRENIWLKPGGIDYEEARFPAAKDPDERIKWLDDNQIGATVFYPSMGISWQAECQDPQLSAAYCCVYNDWLSDFCSRHRNRLIPVAQVPLIDLNEGVKEIKRVAKQGMKGCMYLHQL
jgi:predicted TIM-barrel fold metal-dependent hydrolase